MSPGTDLPGSYNASQYFGLVDAGLIAPDDRVELLAGLVVAMSPQSARHVTALCRVERALRVALGPNRVIRTQMPLCLGEASVPEPDLVVVDGILEDYEDAHPSEAMLCVEVADTSLAQDRLTKSCLYAAAGVPQYWIVNLRDGCVEWHESPDTERAVYLQRGTMRPGESLQLRFDGGPGLSVADFLSAPRHG